MTGFQNGDRCFVCGFWWHADDRVLGGRVRWRSYPPEPFRSALPVMPTPDPGCICPECAKVPA